MTQHPEYRRLVRLAAGYNKKAMLSGARGRITADMLWEIAHREPTCHYCGIELEEGHGSFDHVIPFDRGGRNEAINIVHCCTTCQRRKFTKTPGEFSTHQALVVACSVCGKEFQPRWGEYQRGDARVCSRSCAARKRWQ